jgi:hypothetical protein
MLKLSKRPAAPRIALPLLLMTALSGCESAGKAPLAVTVVDNGCGAFRQLSWSVADTRETSTQVRQHNATHAALCPKAKE